VQCIEPCLALRPTKLHRRVAAVEEKLSELTSLLQSLKQQPDDALATTTRQSTGFPVTSTLPTPASTDAGLSLTADGESGFLCDRKNPPSIVDDHSNFSLPNHAECSFQRPQRRPDVFAQGILTVEKGDELLARYNVMTAHFPFVATKRTMDVASLREGSPMLLLATLDVASKPDKELHRKIDIALREELGKRILLDGEKTLDLLQGITMYLAFYHHHFHPISQQLYQLQMMATATAVELGLYKYGRPRQCDAVSQVPQPLDASQDENSMDDKRTTICCYYLCSSLSLALRRPCSFRYNNFLEDCASQLTARNELPTDKYLIHCIRLQRLAEQACETFGYEDLARPLGFEAIQHTVKGFEERLQMLYRDLPEGASDIGMNRHIVVKECMLTLAVTLQLAYHNAAICIHEVSLHRDLINIQASQGPEAVPATAHNLDTASSGLTSLLFSTLECTRSFLDYFLGLPPAVYRELTIIDLTRVIYAIIMLGKLALDATLGVALASLNTDTRIRAYLDALIEYTRRLIHYDQQGEIMDAFWHFNALCEGTKRWYERRTASNSATQGDGPHDVGVLQFMYQLKQERKAPTEEVASTQDDFSWLADEMMWNEMFLGWQPGLNT
jgi:hypothetical protein